MEITGKKGGVIAAGDALTAKAGYDILNAGGNAFDAAIAATLMSFVSESTLTSPGGGGFFLSHTANGKSVMYDFFTQTPHKRNTSSKLDFYTAYLNFKDSRQAFKIGLASAAVPGNIAGLFHVHKKLGSLPFVDIAEPSIRTAREGVVVTPYIQHNFYLLGDMLLAEEASRNIYKPGGKLLQIGDTYKMENFARLMEALAANGPREFYEGEIARKMISDSAERGGHLTMDDFTNYRVIERSPLRFSYRGHDIITNPPPATGGVLIAFMLKLLENAALDKNEFGSIRHLNCLVDVIRLTDRARADKFDHRPHDENVATDFLETGYLRELGKEIEKHSKKSGNTTHVTVTDNRGNVASVTTSYGTGCGYIMPETDCMLNNMLGEDDLNPNGFHQWPLNQRITSMMAPSIVFENGRPALGLGSGGANRIRTTILQVISNYIDFNMLPDETVNAPRIHWENNVFSYEPGYAEQEIRKIKNFSMYEIVAYKNKSMFFGGVHTVFADNNGDLTGAGDRRREGIVMVC